jgi:hypothetical protein
MTTMHTYRDSADLNSEMKHGVEWTVLFDTGRQDVVILSKHTSLDAAMSRVNYLNGGSGSTAPGR